MKELKLLTEWADNITNEATRLGQPTKGIGDRPIARSQDIMYQAQRKYPDRSPEQALSLFINDKMQDNEKMDYEQNKIINAQKQENEKLRRSLSDLSNELHDHERTAQQTDQEVNRLKDLSAKLKPAGELTKQVAQATNQQIEKMLKDVDDLRMKPGMTPEKQKELEDKINSIKSGGLTSDEVKNINNSIEFLSVKQEIDDEMFNKVMGKLEDTQSKLASKEKRFQKSIRGNAEKIQQWGNKFSELDKKFNDIESKANQKLAQIDKASQEADETLDRIAQLVRTNNPDVVKPATQVLSTLDDRDEVKQAMATPSATTIPANDYDQSEFDNYDTAVATQEPEEEDYADISDLLNKYRKPTNVKKNGNLGEQIEMQEPVDEVETIIIPKLVRRYRNMYPLDLQKWSEEQLKEILRRTVDRRLLIWAPDIDEQRVKNYLEACHHWLRKLRPVTPELPGISDEPPQNAKLPQSTVPQRPIAESAFSDFEKEITKISGGY